MTKVTTTRVYLRIPSEALLALRGEAQRQNRSINNLVTHLITDFIERVKHREEAGELLPPLA